MSGPVSTSRRAVLSGLATLPAIGAGAAAGPRAGNPEIPALIARHALAKAAADQADEIAEERFEAMGGEPDYEPAFYSREGDRALNLFATIHHRTDPGLSRYSGETIEQFRAKPRQRCVMRWQRMPARYEEGYHLNVRRTPDGGREFGIHTLVPWPEAQARADEIVDAYDRHRAELQRREQASGIAEAEAAVKAAWEAAGTILRQLRDVRVYTVADLVLKARFIVAEWDGDLDGIERLRERTDASWPAQFGIGLLTDLHRLGDPT